MKPAFLGSYSQCKSFCASSGASSHRDKSQATFRGLSWSRNSFFTMTEVQITVPSLSSVDPDGALQASDKFWHVNKVNALLSLVISFEFIDQCWIILTEQPIGREFRTFIECLAEHHYIQRDRPFYAVENAFCKIWKLTSSLATAFVSRCFKWLPTRQWFPA